MSSNQPSGVSSEVATRGMLELVTGRIYTKLQSAMSVHEAHVASRIEGLEEQLKKMRSTDRPSPSLSQESHGRKMEIQMIDLKRELEMETLSLRHHLAQQMAILRREVDDLKLGKSTDMAPKASQLANSLLHQGPAEAELQAAQQMAILRKVLDDLILIKSMDIASNTSKPANSLLHQGPAEAELQADLSNMIVTTHKMLEDQAKKYGDFTDEPGLPQLASQDKELYGHVRSIEFDCRTTTLGVETNMTNHQTLVISNIKAGMMWQWNSRNPGKQISVGDEILQVNDVSGSSERLLEELRKRKKSSFIIGSHTVPSQPDFLIEIDHRSNTSLGMELDSYDGETLSILSIGAGLVKEWNDSCTPDKKVRIGDRIIAINEAKGSCVSLLKALRSQDVLKISVAPGMVACTDI